MTPVRIKAGAPDPWCWKIDLHNWVSFGVNLGKYSSTMEHMGGEWWGHTGICPLFWGEGTNDAGEAERKNGVV